MIRTCKIKPLSASGGCAPRPLLPNSPITSVSGSGITMFLVTPLDLTLPELPSKWFDFSWTIYWVNKLYLNCLLSNLTLAELLTGSPDSTWTVYCLTWFWLNCWLVNLTLAKLSSSWFELSWIVYWVTWTVYLLTSLWLNCLRGDWSAGWLVCWLTLPQLNCLRVDLTVTELSTGWLDSSWIVYLLTLP